MILDAKSSAKDGKSTLIGRLLVETDSIPYDTVDTARQIRRAGSTIPAGEMKLYNAFVPLFKLVDQITFKRLGLSVICVIKKAL